MAVGPRKPAEGPVPAGTGESGRGLRRPLALLVGLGGIILMLALPLPALAEGETLGGTLTYRAGDERTPVEGVSITVSQDGTEIGTAESDAEGSWEVPLPGAGTYQVTLDVSTLPEGVRLTDPSRAELPNVAVIGGQRKVVLFPLEEGQGGGGGHRRAEAPGAEAPGAGLASMRESARCSWLVSSWGRPSRSPRWDSR